MSPAGSNIEIRPARPDEMGELERVTRYAFANNEPPKDSDPQPLQPEQSLCAFDGERMVASSGAFDFRIQFNGRTAAAHGVTLVACDPGYRRRGIVRQLIDGLLQRAKAEEVPLSMLWASMGAIYQRFGYGLGTTHVQYDVPVRHVEFQFGERPEGVVRLLEKDDALPLLTEVYRAYSGPANGMLHRGQLFWDLMLRRAENQHTYIAVYFDRRERPRGYCLYRTRWDDQVKAGMKQVVDVFDFIWLDMEAYRGLWLYLGGHDLAERIRFDYVAEDDPAPNLFLEPRMLRRRTSDGIWMRVVDAAQALDVRGYDQPGEAVIEIVEDDLCGWNNGRYRLTTDGDGLEVTRPGAGVTPDIIAPPAAFASLVTGHTRVSDLARMGRLEVADRNGTAALDALFSTRRRPHCPNEF